MTKLFALVLLSLLCSSSACAEGEPTSADTAEVGEAGEDDPAVTRLAEPPESRPRPLVARLPEISLELEARVEVGRDDQGVFWRARGTASAPLRDARGWVPDDAFAQVELTGPRDLSIVLRDPSEKNTLLSGMPLFLSLVPVDGPAVEAALWLRPRLSMEPARAGEGRLRFYSAVKPIWLAGDVSYRGRLGADPGWTISIASNPAPEVGFLGGNLVRLDWRFDALRAALEASAATLRGRAVRGATVLERSAVIEVRVVRLGLTRRDPREVWPSACDERVRACLAALPPGQVDTEPCGSYRQVLACGGPAGARAGR